MSELVIEPDYMNAFKISFHINEHGLEMIKEPVRPKYLNEYPVAQDKTFYTRDILKGRVISVTHKQEFGSQYTLGVGGKYLGVNYQKQDFKVMKQKLQKFGWKATKEEGDIHETKFYRIVSAVNLGAADIGSFTNENANKIYTFVRSNLYSDDHGNNVNHLSVNSQGTSSSFKNLPIANSSSYNIAKVAKDTTSNVAKTVKNVAKDTTSNVASKVGNVQNTRRNRK